MNSDSPIVMEITSPAEAAYSEAQRRQFDRNSVWLQAHAAEIYSEHRGKCICVAGEEVFIADTARDALAKATVAHPDDKGRFVHYIPRDKVARIYAN